MPIPKWQENRERIEANYQELGKRYEALTKLNLALCDLIQTFVLEATKLRKMVRRPGQIANMDKNVKTLRTKLEEFESLFPGDRPVSGQ